MGFLKPLGITFQQIADSSKVSIRTIKRYANGGNITTHNADLINQAVAVLQSPSKTASNGIILASEEEFFFPKKMFKQQLFWSSPVDKVRNIDGVIEVYVKTPNIYDIHILTRLFGSDRIIAIAERVYNEILKDFSIQDKKPSFLPEYQAVARMVKYSTSIGDK
jgi:transcriptional regulator with XRE-family HTH domain